MHGAGVLGEPERRERLPLPVREGDRLPAIERMR
jgi:hypothetical protein